MAKLKFQDLTFKEEKEKVRVMFLKYYSFFTDKKDLERISKFKINKNSIEFDTSEKTARNKFSRLLKTGFDNLKNVYGKKTVYIHKNSGIPLLGTNEFGIIDRGTNCIEVKPLTICNLNCIYCSVDAGSSSKKTTDFVVEKDYLAEELEKTSLLKKKPLEININPQGEPLMYAPLYDLIHYIKALKGVKIVSLNTNGILLNEKTIDRLKEAGLGRINLSLNALTQEVCDKLADNKYPLKKVKRIIDYCKGKIDVLIAPVIVPGFNEKEMPRLIDFAKKRNMKLGFQNFLNYTKGRNPTKQNPMKKFLKELKEYEKTYVYPLIQTPEDFEICEDTKIEKPFKKGEVVRAKIVCPGKYSGERIAVADERCITVNCDKPIGKNITVRIVRDKHNIFKGVLLKKR